MRRKWAYVLVLLLLSPAFSQQHPNRIIFGVVVRANGEPARNLRLTAKPSPSPGGHSGDFPHTRTNNLGEYRFQNLPSWGMYMIYADDEAVGYSRTSTCPVDWHTDAIITPEHPEAEFNFSLARQSGFIRIHLTSRRTGAAIHTMRVSVLPLDKEGACFGMSGGSDHAILVPPDQNLLIHVSSEGFREWDESIGAGRPINVPSGAVVVLDIQLEPLD
jgi:hypothetical protein